MPTPNGDETTPGHDGAVSIRVERGKSWRAHVPAALIVSAVVGLGQLGGCSKQDEITRRLDELNTRVSRIEGALGVRTASLEGGEGTGGGTSKAE